MTETPSTPDLASRILDAIDELENAAREAKYGGEWWSTRHNEVPLVMADVAAVDDEGELREYVATDVERSTAVHIALHDPKTVLLRCAADRRTVERHRQPGRAEMRGNQDGTWLMQWCNCCGALMPCPDLQDRAAAYDITEETATA